MERSTATITTGEIKKNPKKDWVNIVHKSRPEDKNATVMTKKICKYARRGYNASLFVIDKVRLHCRLQIVHMSILSKNQKKIKEIRPHALSVFYYSSLTLSTGMLKA